MKILIACECSGMIRDAFLALGHDAMSCDLKQTQRPGPHYQGDVRDVLYDRWDALIAHPVCKYMANSGAKHLYLRIEGKWAKENGINEERWEKMRQGAEFFKLFDRAEHIPLRCVENPIMHGHALALVGRTATQFVQPHWFGDPFSKATGLWLTGFKPLVRTHWMDPELIEQAVWKMPPSDDREEGADEIKGSVMPFEDTTATKPCPGCGAEGFHTKYMGKTGERMTRTGECYSCAHWELQCEAGAPLVIDHYVYSIGYEPKDEEARYRAQQRKDLGMSGRRFDIEFFDGRRFTTHNLWAGGAIPERYWARLPDTAKFIGGERADASGTTCWNPADERAPAYPAYRS